MALALQPAVLRCEFVLLRLRLTMLFENLVEQISAFTVL
jgi:hypothetical protein